MSLPSFVGHSSDDILLLARIAEQAEQFDDMVAILKPYFEAKEEDLSLEERNELCVAYKNAIGKKRIAYRAAKKVSQMSKYDDFSEESTKYTQKLEEEVVELCKDMHGLIQKQLLPKAKKSGKVESQVFYNKLMGDYFRYVAEVGDGERLQKASERALNSYNDAIQKAEHLSPADPTRLSL